MDISGLLFLDYVKLMNHYCLLLFWLSTGSIEGLNGHLYFAFANGAVPHHALFGRFLGVWYTIAPLIKVDLGSRTLSLA